VAGRERFLFLKVEGQTSSLFLLDQSFSLLCRCLGVRMSDGLLTRSRENESIDVISTGKIQENDDNAGKKKNQPRKIGGTGGMSCHKREWDEVDDKEKERTKAGGKAGLYSWGGWVRRVKLGT